MRIEFEGPAHGKITREAEVLVFVGDLDEPAGRIVQDKHGAWIPDSALMGEYGVWPSNPMDLGRAKEIALRVIEKSERVKGWIRISDTVTNLKELDTMLEGFTLSMPTDQADRFAEIVIGTVRKAARELDGALYQIEEPNDN